ncbi:hypothetical protein RFI_21607 [Reticulomyxa filosa]|uniref:Uncharacterized protein n=1 Tax=Reticulomyxa filosa TaxID=46433 RepID=X6MQN2_RETFI|nr:hypothetical protein RFI_21607 [Reticulomyxa filosa]|eukprot:ETO15757.1 hypothetical protein RFI_21607 [Reticulomyxa filosa]
MPLPLLEAEKEIIITEDENYSQEIVETCMDLMRKYFEYNSSPSNVSGLCDLMDEDIVAHYTRNNLHGKKEYKEYVTSLLTTADKISNHEVRGVEYKFLKMITQKDQNDIKENGAPEPIINQIKVEVKWKYAMELIGCTKCCFFTCCICCICCLPKVIFKSGVNYFCFKSTSNHVKISFVQTIAN